MGNRYAELKIVNEYNIIREQEKTLYQMVPFQNQGESCKARIKRICVYFPVHNLLNIANQMLIPQEVQLSTT